MVSVCAGIGLSQKYDDLYICSGVMALIVICLLEFSLIIAWFVYLGHFLFDLKKTKTLDLLEFWRNFRPVNFQK